MMLPKNLASVLKMIIYFKQPFYSLISVVNSEYVSPSGLIETYGFFATQTQEYIKYKRRDFDNYFDELNVDFDDELKIETISLVNGNDSKIIKEWKGSKSEEFIALYNEEIEREILSNLTKDKDKVQIKVKINEKVKEFIFVEFTVSGEYIEFSNCRFSSQEQCYLDYFPKKVRSINYLLHYLKFCIITSGNSSENFNAKNIIEGPNIKSSTIITLLPSDLFYDSKAFKKPNKFKFTEFDLSIKQSDEFEETEKTTEKISLSKPLTLFFEATKKITEIRFDVFSTLINSDENQIINRKIFFEILKDEKVTRKVEENLSFSLIEIEKKENFLKVILRRPTGEGQNPLKVKDSLSIKFLDLSAEPEFSKSITLNAKEEIIDDVIFTTFTVEKDEKKGTNSKLYNAIEKTGLVSITLNGNKGIIGTYGLSAIESTFYKCIYSDKLLSIPLEEKIEFFTKKVIIVVFLVGLIIFMCIFAYFYTKKKKESLNIFNS